MELLGAFRNFDLTTNLMAAFFILRGEWNVYLLSGPMSIAVALDHSGWKQNCLGEGKMRLAKMPHQWAFYAAAPCHIEIRKTGTAKNLLMISGDFKILLNVGDVGEEVNLSTTAIFAGSHLRIDTINFNLSNVYTNQPKGGMRAWK